MAAPGNELSGVAVQQCQQGQFLGRLELDVNIEYTLTHTFMLFPKKSWQCMGACTALGSVHAGDAQHLHVARPVGKC